MAKTLEIEAESNSWSMIALNHPVGKAIRLICHLDEISAEEQENTRCGAILRDTVERLNMRMRKESDQAKCSVAALFSHLSVLQKHNPEQINSLLVPMLSSDEWTALPAWEGMAAHYGGMSFDVWEETVSYWPDLFTGKVVLGKDSLNSLARLYVFVAIAKSSNDDCKRMISLCASTSPESCRTAYSQIEQWLKSVEDEGRSLAWDSWLREVTEYLYRQHPELTNTLVDFLARWIREYPMMRSRLIDPLSVYVSTALPGDLFVHNGTLEDVAKDSHISEGQKARCITALLSCQKYLHYENDTRAAAKYIDISKLTRSEADELKNAYARRGLDDAFTETSRC